MHRLLTDLTAEHFTSIYGALPDDMSRAFDPAIAKILNARLPKIRKTPVAMRAKALRAFLMRDRDDDVAGDILRAYFLGPKLELVTDFLDGTGVKHEKGEVEEDSEPDGGRVPSTITSMLEDHDRADIALYLQIASQQWPDIEALGHAAEELSAPA